MIITRRKMFLIFNLSLFSWIFVPIFSLIIFPIFLIFDLFSYIYCLIRGDFSRRFSLVSFLFNFVYNFWFKQFMLFSLFRYMHSVNKQLRKSSCTYFNFPIKSSIFVFLISLFLGLTISSFAYDSDFTQQNVGNNNYFFPCYFSKVSASYLNVATLKDSDLVNPVPSSPYWHSYDLVLDSSSNGGSLPVVEFTIDFTPFRFENRLMDERFLSDRNNSFVFYFDYKYSNMKAPLAVDVDNMSFAFGGSSLWRPFRPFRENSSLPNGIGVYISDNSWLKGYNNHYFKIRVPFLDYFDEDDPNVNALFSWRMSVAFITSKDSNSTLDLEYFLKYNSLNNNYGFGSYDQVDDYAYQKGFNDGFDRGYASAQGDPSSSLLNTTFYLAREKDGGRLGEIEIFGEGLVADYKYFDANKLVLDNLINDLLAKNSADYETISYIVFPHQPPTSSVYLEFSQISRPDVNVFDLTISEFDKNLGPLGDHSFSLGEEKNDVDYGYFNNSALSYYTGFKFSHVANSFGYLRGIYSPQQQAIYNKGYHTGYDLGYEAGRSSGYNTGYSVGFDDGYASGVKDSDLDNTFGYLFLSVLNAPLNFLRGALDFDILGINFYQIIFSLVTLGLSIYIIRKFF